MYDLYDKIKCKLNFKDKSDLKDDVAKYDGLGGIAICIWTAEEDERYYGQQEFWFTLDGVNPLFPYWVPTEDLEI